MGAGGLVRSGGSGAQAALVSELPMTGAYLTHDFLVEGQQLSAGEEPDVQTLSVEGDYFRVPQIMGGE